MHIRRLQGCGLLSMRVAVVRDMRLLEAVKVIDPVLLGPGRD